MKHGACQRKTDCRRVPSARARLCRMLLLVALCTGFDRGVARAEPLASNSVETPGPHNLVASVDDDAGLASPAEAAEWTSADGLPGDGENMRSESPSESATPALPEELRRWVDSERLSHSVQLGVTMVLLGLVPAFLLMTTSYIRISIVLSLLRQAFGAQLLPMQVTSALAMLCTGLVMWPTWQSVHEQAIMPWMQGTESTDLMGLWDEGIEPIRAFMIRQISASRNGEDVHLFLQQGTAADEYPSSWDQVPLRALLPAFVISELKTAFLIGFRIYLPFLVIDLVVATATTSMGMFMLPPNMVSLPLKLLLFVMVDGWRLIVEMLLTSFP
jgi:flagellar biosynthetic protein FliP